MVDIESRKATVRALYRESPHELRPEASRALAEAEEYFGVGPTRRKDLPPNILEVARYHDVVILARLMAEVLFGKPGRGRQTKDWSEGKLYILGQAYFYVKRKKPALKDRQIAEIFAGQHSDDFGKNGFGKDAELIRQRLPAAKRVFTEYCVGKASGYVNAVFCEEEIFVLEKMGLIAPRPPVNLVAGPIMANHLFGSSTAGRTIRPIQKTDLTSGLQHSPRTRHDRDVPVECIRWPTTCCLTRTGSTPLKSSGPRWAFPGVPASARWLAAMSR